jgi:hypothetical protein
MSNTKQRVSVDRQILERAISAGFAAVWLELNIFEDQA